MAMDLIDINDNPLTRRQGSIPRLAGPAPETLPADGLRTIYPEQTPRLSAPQSIGQLAAQATEGTPAASGPLARAAGIATRVAPAAGAIGLLAGGAAASNFAANTVSRNPEAFADNGILGNAMGGDNALAANIMKAAATPRIAEVATQAPETARTQNGPINVPIIAQQSQGSEQRFPPAPQYDDTYRAQNLANMQNQAAREGDPIGAIIAGRTPQASDQPPAGGDASQPPVGKGGKPIMFATFGGPDGAKAFYQDGTTASTKAGQPLPDDIQAFNQQSAQAGMDNQQPVQIIRGDQQHGNSFGITQAQPNPTAKQAAGYMQEVPMDVAQAGPDAIKNFQTAQAQNAVNRADPNAAQVRAKVAESMGDPSMVSNGTKQGGSADGNSAVPLTGEDYLKTLPPARANQLRQINDGKMQVTQMMLAKAPGMMTQLAQAFPDFDTADANARYKTVQSFNGSGKDGASVKSINQAIGHANEVYDAISALDNYGGMKRPLNAIANTSAENFKDDSRQGVLREKTQALASELRTAFSASGGNLKEVEDWKAAFPENASKKQQLDYLRGGMDLLHGVTEALQSKADTGMGKPGAIQVVNPKSQAILDKIYGKGATNGTANAPAQTAAAPQSAPHPDLNSMEAELKRRGLLK